MPAAGVARNPRRRHAGKTLFNQIIIRQKDIRRLPAAQREIVRRPAAYAGQRLQLLYSGVDILRREEGEIAADSRLRQMDQRLRAPQGMPSAFSASGSACASRCALGKR